MRDYSKVAPTYWTGETGRKLREAGRDAQLVALYLITCPNASAVGIFDMPIPLLCHHTGLSREGALKALQRVSEAGFATFDPPSEVVFVPLMALHQIGPRIGAKDNRHKWLMKELSQWKKSPFIHDFVRIYGESYAISGISPFEGPSKPLRSQEQEQEREIEQEQEVNTPPSPPRGRFVKPTIEEVREYCSERSNSVDPQTFVDHYESKGWVVGRSPMKDWKACVRTWEKNGYGKSSGPGNSRPGGGGTARIETSDPIRDKIRRREQETRASLGLGGDPPQGDLFPELEARGAANHSAGPA